MFFRRLYSFLAMLICLLGFGAVQAQGQVSVIISGKNKGAVESMSVNGVTYVDVQRTARKLGADVELFAASKQVKISAKGFYAVLTAPIEEIIDSIEKLREVLNKYQRALSFCSSLFAAFIAASKLAFVC